MTDSEVRYDLDIRTYDDLRVPGTLCPRLLLVLVLPENEAEWVSQTPEELTVRRCAYWLSLEGFPEVAVARSIRVPIPRANVFSAEAVRNL